MGVRDILYEELDWLSGKALTFTLISKDQVTLMFLEIMYLQPNRSLQPL